MKPLYRTTVFLPFVKKWFIRFIILILNTVMIVHFNQHPYLYSIAISFLFYVGSYLFDDEFAVYDSYFLYKRKFIFGLYVTKLSFDYKDIVDLVLDGKSSEEVLAFNAQMPEKLEADSKSYLEVKLRNKTEIIRTQLPVFQLQEVMSIVMEYVHLKVKS